MPSGHVHRIGSVGSEGRHVFNFIRNCQGSVPKWPYHFFILNSSVWAILVNVNCGLNLLFSDEYWYCALCIYLLEIWISFAMYLWSLSPVFIGSVVCWISFRCSLFWIRLFVGYFASMFFQFIVFSLSYWCFLTSRNTIFPLFFLFCVLMLFFNNYMVLAFAFSLWIFSNYFLFWDEARIKVKFFRDKYVPALFSKKIFPPMNFDDAF